MKELFVSKEIALELKDLGFDELCFACIGAYSEDFMYCYNLHTTTIRNSRSLEVGASYAIPIYQQAFKWFRDNHKLYHLIAPFETKNDKLIFSFQLFEIDEVGLTLIEVKQDFNTYEETELECLKELIKIVQQKKVNKFFEELDSKQSTDDRI